MGDMVLEAVVGDVVERVISLAVDEIGLLLGVKDEVQNLRTVLTSIQAVLQDAEEKQVKDKTVKVWLQELKQVAYDAEDVLDEITYEKLKYEIINKACRWFSPSRLIVHVKMAHKIKDINGRLDVIEKNKNMFQLVVSNVAEPAQMFNARETSSFVDDSTVIGRESEMKAIIQMLINDHDGSSSSNSTVHQEISGDNTPLSVICIVGLGGLGKTTLAQLVYNNDAVKKHFNKNVWICVSVHFNTKNLFAQILKQINPNDSKPEPSTKQELENDLQSRLQGNKILLVLDDVWNEDQEMWEDLLHPLRSFSARGSKFIVTSRSRKVASAARAIMYQLQGLSDDSCWGLIERRAFVVGGPVEKTPQLVRIGKEISQKCKGVPLAAKVLGGMLQSKKQEQEWLAVRDADFTSDGRDPIMEVLKLSYYNLPSTLKSCFSYCAIFPKDHWIYRETLIELWMSQGLLGASDNRGEIMEDKGNTYFDILYSKSFFQEAELNEYGEVIRCKMHDLLNDLTQSICKFECHNFGENVKMCEDLSKCRHVSFISPTTIETLCKKAKKVRTIFGWRSSSIEFDNGGTMRTIFYWESDSDEEFNDGGTEKVTKINTFFKFKLLRVLDLSGFRGFDFSSSSLGKLKHLRYLDLSLTSIESLPKWVTRLYQLQTLKLIECYKLKELHGDLMNLKKLRHLFIDDYEKWKKLAEAVGELHQLRTLPLFVVCKEDAGRGISVLKNLNNLRGSLKIHCLCLVKEVSLAKGAKLSDKGNLRELSLHWDSEDSNDSCAGDLQVLKELQPHPNLKGLSIEGFGGVEFPGWVSNGSLLPNLMAIKISKCNQCEHVPSFGELPQLESLEMEKMSSVKRIGSGRGASQSSSSSSSYPHLKKLVVRSLPNLEEWSGDAADGVLFPSLQSLKLDNVGGMGVVSITTSLTSLTSLYIAECEDLEFLPERLLLRNNNQLDVVHIWKCPKLQAFREEDEMMMMVANSISPLRELAIKGCDALKSIPDVRGFTCLQKLEIWWCDELETIPKGFFSSLVALKSLGVCGCHKLKGTIELSPTSLKHLRELQIVYCSKLQGLDICTASTEQEQVLFPCCHTLVIRGCPVISSIDVRSFASVRRLMIRDCRGLQALQGLVFLSSLERLELGPFSEDLDSFPLLLLGGGDGDGDNGGDVITLNTPLLPSLRNLQIWGWDTLQSLPYHLQFLTMLKYLYIKEFTNLKKLPEWLGNLASLEGLRIRRCENLTHLPSKEQMQRLTNLNNLNISECPQLKERCSSSRDVSEWTKISHIPRLYIND